MTDLIQTQYELELAMHNRGVALLNKRTERNQLSGNKADTYYGNHLIKSSFRL